MKNTNFYLFGAFERCNWQNAPSFPAGGGKAPFLLIYQLIFMMTCFWPDIVVGQNGGPGSSWQSSINFNGVSAPGTEDTWAFDAKEADGGEFVIVGYVEVDGTSSQGCEGIHNDNNRIPGYAVVDKTGNLIASAYFQSDPGTSQKGPGVFNQVVKVSDGFILAGHQRRETSNNPCDQDNGYILLVKLNNDFQQVWAVRYSLPEATGSHYVTTAGIFKTPNNEDKIMVSGRCGDGFIALFDADGTHFLHRFIADLVPNMENGLINEIKMVPENDPTHVIFVGFRYLTDQVINMSPGLKNSSGVVVGGIHSLEDFDAFVGSIPIAKLLDPNAPNPGFVNYYNSEQGFNATNTNMAIIPQYPIECPGQYGPVTPGKSLDCVSPAVNGYLSDNSRDEGRSLVQIGDYIYAAIEMDIILMTAGKYVGMHYSEPNGDPGAGIDLSPCMGHKSDEYKDAYIYILKINATTGDLVDARNVAHFSGGDFTATLIEDRTDNNIVLAGTTADKNICGLPDAEGAESNMLIKIDAGDLSTIWKEHYLVDGADIEGTCAFGLIQTSDNGFVIIGNQETENGDETFNLIHFASECQSNPSFFDLNGDYSVNLQQEIWSTANKPNPYRVNGNIIIPNGNQLIINGITVEFASTKNKIDNAKSGITVMAGGNLTLRNTAVLKGLNCGSEQMWDGIVALGITHLSQLPQFQAHVYVSQNSRIENAMRGTVLGDAGWTTEEGSTSVNGTVGTVSYQNYYETYTQGGGHLEASSSFYRNCGKGVVWNPYGKVSNLSKLTNVTFECTGALADPDYRSFFTALGEPVNTETFCEIQSNRGISFRDCKFLNTGSNYLNPRNKPSGILSMDGHFQTSGAATLFQNLYIGINASGIASGIPSAISVKDANFDNCYQSTNLIGTMGSQVEDCAYTAMPNNATVLDGDASGIFCAKSSGYALKSNHLYGNDDNYGIIARLSGDNGAQIEGNTLTDFLKLANLFEFNNSNLQTHCNTYQGAVGDASWDVRGALANQINPFDASYFPDNKFLWDCGGPLLDIRSTPSFSYYERLQTAQNSGSILLCYSPTVTRIQGNLQSTTPNCLIEEACPNPPYCGDLTNTYNNSGHSLPYRNDLLHAYIRMSPGVVSDSLYLPGISRAVTLLASRNQQADKQVLTATYTALEDYTMAQQYLQQLPVATPEMQDFVQFYSVLINAGLAGRDAYHLTPSEFGLLAPLMANNSAVSDQVKVLDHLLNGVYHPLSVELNTAGRPDDRTAEIVDPHLVDRMVVMPNPFSDEIRFVAPVDKKITSICMMDISGRSLVSQKYELGEAIVLLHAGSMSEGVLFYTCQLSDGQTMHGKVIHSGKK